MEFDGLVWDLILSFIPFTDFWRVACLHKASCLAIRHSKWRIRIKTLIDEFCISTYPKLRCIDQASYFCYAVRDYKLFCALCAKKAKDPCTLLRFWKLAAQKGDTLWMKTVMVLKFPLRWESIRMALIQYPHLMVDFNSYFSRDEKSKSMANTIIHIRNLAEKYIENRNGDGAKSITTIIDLYRNKMQEDDFSITTTCFLIYAFRMVVMNGQWEKFENALAYVNSHIGEQYHEVWMYIRWKIFFWLRKKNYSTGERLIKKYVDLDNLDDACALRCAIEDNKFEKIEKYAHSIITSRHHSQIAIFLNATFRWGNEILARKGLEWVKQCTNDKNMISHHSNFISCSIKGSIYGGKIEIFKELLNERKNYILNNENGCDDFHLIYWRECKEISLRTYQSEIFALCKKKCKKHQRFLRKIPQIK